MNKREAHWIHDDKGGYWQIPVGGKPYNFRTPPGFVMHPKGEAVTDAEILWDMRHIDDHLKYSEDAASMLIQGVRRVLRRVMRPPAEAQPVAWMDPDSEDVIHDMRKTSWSSDYGVGGEKKARTYTTPLYAHPPPSAPAAVDGAMVERIAALLHEEATDEPWAVAGVEHDGPDRDYYRTLARKVLARAGKQPAASDELTELVRLLDEVRSHFTRDDDLPGDLLPRIDAALAQQPAACPKCDGTGEADSGGIHPWGAPATIPCDCQQPAAGIFSRIRQTPEYAREVEKLASALGYQNAFHEVAAMLDIPAQPLSPKEVWETQMRPKLLALTSQQPAAVDEFVSIDGKQYAIDTVRTALLGLAADYAAQQGGKPNGD